MWTKVSAVCRVQHYLHVKNPLW